MLLRAVLMEVVIVSRLGCGKSGQKEMKECVKVDWRCHGHLMFLLDGALRELRARCGDRSLRQGHSEAEWKLSHLLYADYYL